MTTASSSSWPTVGRPRLFGSLGYQAWRSEWDPILTEAYGDNVRVADYLEHFPGSRRTFYTYLRLYGKGTCASST